MTKTTLQAIVNGIKTDSLLAKFNNSSKGSKYAMLAQMLEQDYRVQFDCRASVVNALDAMAEAEEGFQWTVSKSSVVTGVRRAKGIFKKAKKDSNGQVLTDDAGKIIFEEVVDLERAAKVTANREKWLDENTNEVVSLGATYFTAMDRAIAEAMAKALEASQA